MDNSTDKMNPHPSPSSWVQANRPALLGSGSMVLLFLVMLVMSWRKWADLIVDSGKQLYIPWILSEGHVLYRDVMYLYGPLSSYVHALIFKIFGPGLLHLAFFNIILTALLAVLIYRLIQQFSETSTATMATLVFIGIFAFSCLKGYSAFNFVFPYVFDLTHGVILSFIALLQFNKYVESPTTSKLISVGSLLGLVYLTKAEVFLAAFTSMSLGLVVFTYLKKSSVKSWALNVSIFLISFLIPSLLFTVYFAFHMPVAEAFQAMISPWGYVLNPDIRELSYYQDVAGTGDLASNAIIIGWHILADGLVILALFIVNHLFSRMKNSRLIPFYCAAGLLGLGLIFFKDIRWLEIARPFPFYVLAFGIFLGYRILKNRNQLDFVKEQLPLWVFSIFAFVLTFKSLFNLNFSYLGFVFGLPATLVVLIVLSNKFSGYAQRLSGSSLNYRAMIFALPALVILILMVNSYSFYDSKTYPVGNGADTLYDLNPKWDPNVDNLFTRGIITNEALEYLNTELKEDDTFATFPDTPILNYFMRRKSPIKYIDFDPLLWTLFGDEAVLNALKSSTPPYIIFVDTKNIWMGKPFFGLDYGLPVYDWVIQNYDMVKQIGPKPFFEDGFGLQVYKLRSHSGEGS